MERELEEFHPYWNDQAPYNYHSEKRCRFDDQRQRYREEAAAELFDGISLKYLEKLENLKELLLENQQFTDFEAMGTSHFCKGVQVSSLACLVVPYQCLADDLPQLIC